MNDLTDTEKIELQKQILRQGFPLPIFCLLVVAVIEPVAAPLILERYLQGM